MNTVLSLHEDLFEQLYRTWILYLEAYIEFYHFFRTNFEYTIINDLNCMKKQDIQEKTKTLEFKLHSLKMVYLSDLVFSSN